MITREEVKELRYSKETARVERTISTGDMDKFQEAICAFSKNLVSYIILSIVFIVGKKTIKFYHLLVRECSTSNLKLNIKFKMPTGIELRPIFLHNNIEECFGI